MIPLRSEREVRQERGAGKPKRPPTFRRTLILRLGLLLGTLVVVEIALALLQPISYRRPPRSLPDDVWRELLHRPSRVPGLAYELKPCVRGRHRGALVVTNSHGMRDREPLPETGAPILRIAVLGDSFTFGFGVENGETYPQVLEHELDRSGIRPRTRFDALNLGVGGYSSRDEALVLEHKALRWDPALVIVGYVLNDPETEPLSPLQSHYAEDVRWWQHVNLFRLAAEAWWGVNILRLGGGDYYRYVHSSPEKWSSVLEAFRRIRRLTSERDIPALLVIFPMMRRERWAEYPYRDLHEKVAAAAKEEGLAVLDLLPAFSEHAPSEIRHNAADPHPNVLGHVVAAEAIRDALLRDPSLLGR